jgi:FKBP-type peptidyl-prolyl cis-trans isomerase
MKTFRTISAYGFLLVLTLLAVSCVTSDDSKLITDEQRALKQYLLSHKITAAPRPSGLYYLPTDSGTGISPTINDVIFFNYTLRLVNDVVIRSTIDSIAKINNFFNGGLFFRPYENRISWWFPGLQEGFPLMREGSKATFIIPSKLAYGSAGAAALGIGSYVTLIYDIELIKVIHDPVGYEKEAIQKYVHDSIPSSLTVNINDSGVYHIIDQAGSGDMPVANKIVSIRYTLKLLDGSIVQRISPTDDPYSYTVGVDNVIPGFEQVVKTMQKGEEAWVIIPYKQAYGEQTSNVPSFSTLVYYMSIVDIQ